MEQKEIGVDRQDRDDAEVHLSIENVTPQTTADSIKLSKFPPRRLVSVLQFHVSVVHVLPQETNLSLSLAS